MARIIDDQRMFPAKIAGESREGIARLVLVVAGVAALVGLAAGCDVMPGGAYDRISAGIDRLASDRDRLQAENYRLREEVRCLRPCVETCHGVVDGVACVRDCPPIGCPVAGTPADGGAAR